MLEIHRIHGRRGRARFVDLPWHVYDQSRHPGWTPPLRTMVLEVLDEKKNPFFRDADVALFVATRDGRPVGRIAAIENRAYNAFHGDRVGFFGFLDAEDDAETVRALLEAAEEWLEKRGLTRIQGPFHPSTNYESGMLVEGCDEPSWFMTPWNPSYLPRHIEEAGWVRAKDLLGFHLDVGAIPADAWDRLGRLREVARERFGVSFRRLEASRFEEEMRSCWSIYTAAWQDNWGFAPVSEEEWLYLTHGLKPLMVSIGALAVDVKGRPAAFALVLPDYNQALRRIGSGRLLPFGWLHLLRARSWEGDRARVVALGVRPEYRKRAILPLLLRELLEEARRQGVDDVEGSWVLEDNAAMTQALETLGAEPYRRWRIYERGIGNGD